MELLDDANVRYTRRFVLFDGEYSPELFNEFYSFIRSAKATENMKLVMVREGRP
jgi:hypothetical protein